MGLKTSKATCSLLKCLLLHWNQTSSLHLLRFNCFLFNPTVHLWLWLGFLNIGWSDHVCFSCVNLFASFTLCFLCFVSLTNRKLGQKLGGNPIHLVKYMCEGIGCLHGLWMEVTVVIIWLVRAGVLRETLPYWVLAWLGNELLCFAF